jgi:hypothetical protein
MRNSISMSMPTFKFCFDLQHFIAKHNVKYTFCVQGSLVTEALNVCVWFCCTFLFTNCLKILLWRMVRVRTLSSLNIPVVRILVFVLHLFGAFFKTIHFGCNRQKWTNHQPHENSKMYCKTHVFDNDWKICKSSQATQIIAKHNASCHQTKACFRHEVRKTIVNTMRKPYPDISIYTPRTSHARFKKP